MYNKYKNNNKKTSVILIWKNNNNSKVLITRDNLKVLLSQEILIQ